MPSRQNPGIAGAVLDMRVFRGMSDTQFNKVVNVALVASGLALVLNSEVNVCALVLWPKDYVRRPCAGTRDKPVEFRRGH